MELVTVLDALEAIRHTLGIRFGSLTAQWVDGEPSLIRMQHTLKPADLAQLELRAPDRADDGSVT